MASRRGYRLLGWGMASSFLVTFALFKYGAKVVLEVGLVVVCAYLNVLLLRHLSSKSKQHYSNSLALFLTAVLANVLALYVTGFSLLTAAVVWLPAVAGIFAGRLLRPG